MGGRWWELMLRVGVPHRDARIDKGELRRGRRRAARRALACGGRRGRDEDVARVQVAVHEVVHEEHTEHGVDAVVAQPLGLAPACT